MFKDVICKDFDNVNAFELTNLLIVAAVPRRSVRD